jgi:hypothetical protein
VEFSFSLVFSSEDKKQEIKIDMNLKINSKFLVVRKRWFLLCIFSFLWWGLEEVGFLVRLLTSKYEKENWYLIALPLQYMIIIKYAQDLSTNIYNPSILDHDNTSIHQQYSLATAAKTCI